MIEIFEQEDGWYWREVIAKSKSYPTEEAALRGAQRHKENQPAGRRREVKRK